MLVLCPIHAPYLWKSHKVAKLQDVHGDIFYSVNASHSELDLRMNTNFDCLAFHMAYDFASLSSPPLKCLTQAEHTAPLSGQGLAKPALGDWGSWEG